MYVADFILYITQLTGCSYLVLQFHSVFWGLTSFSKAALAVSSIMLYMRCLPCSRGVSVSLYKLIALFVAKRGAPQYYSPFNQVEAVAPVYSTFIIAPCTVQDYFL